MRPDNQVIKCDEAWLKGWMEGKNQEGTEKGGLEE